MEILISIFNATFHPHWPSTWIRFWDYNNLKQIPSRVWNFFSIHPGGWYHLRLALGGGGSACGVVLFLRAVEVCGLGFASLSVWRWSRATAADACSLVKLSFQLLFLSAWHSCSPPGDRIPKQAAERGFICSHGFVMAPLLEGMPEITR